MKTSCATPGSHELDLDQQQQTDLLVAHAWEMMAPITATTSCARTAPTVSPSVVGVIIDTSLYPGQALGRACRDVLRTSIEATNEARLSSARSSACPRAVLDFIEKFTRLDTQQRQILGSTMFETGSADRRQDRGAPHAGPVRTHRGSDR